MMKITRSPEVWSYEDIARGGDEVRALLQNRGIALHRDSALSKLLKQATKLANEWRTGSGASDGKTLVDASNANRIIQAVKKAAAHPNSLECLKRIANNDMDLSQRDRSLGKDALWEIELFAMLASRQIPTQFHEPDIVADFGLGDYGIACKKVYSDNGRTVEAQVQAGARQIARSGRPGIVAINIDDLAPAETILSASAEDEATGLLANFIDRFIQRHHAKTKRYLSDGRCDGILVSITVPSDLRGSSPTFNRLRHMTLWRLDTASMAAQARTNLMALYFRDIMD